MISFQHITSLSLVISFVHSISFQTFQADSPVSHISTYNSTLFVGSKNKIYQIDKNFNNLQSITTKPHSGEENSVTLMLVHPDPAVQVLFWCGKAANGSCHVNSLGNINSGDYLDEDYFTDILDEKFDQDNIKDKKLLNTGVFGHLGAGDSSAMFIDISTHDILPNVTRTNYTLLSSAVYNPSRRDARELPVLGIYSLLQNRARDFFVKPTIFSPPTEAYSWLTVSDQVRHEYPIHHISMLEEGNYVYMVTLQRSNVTSTNTHYPFQTRIVRFNKFEMRFQHYIEVPVTCIGRSRDHNIAIDAQIAPASADMATQLGASAGEKILYVIQGQSDNGDRFPTADSAAICGVSLSKLNQYMDRERQRCHRGRGSLVEWFKGQQAPCETVSIVDPETERTSTESKFSLMKGRTLQLDTVQVLSYNATMMYTENQRGATVSIIGTHTGQVHKMNLVTGDVYGSYSVSSGVSRVHKDTQLSATGDLYLMAGSQVISFPMRSCRVYETADQCTSTTDPLRCGWCQGRSCMTELECLESGSTEWYPHAPPPNILSVSPLNGSITGNTLLTIVGSHFTSNQSDQSSTVSVFLNNIACSVTSAQFNRIHCRTGQSLSAWTGEMIIAVRNVGSGNMSNIVVQGHNPNVIYSYLKQQVTEITPLYGPRIGGTEITISGNNLQIGNSVSVKIGRTPCDITRVSNEKITCRSRPSLRLGSSNLTLISDGTLQYSSQFQYRPDPIISLNQTSQKIMSLFSGGIPVCVEGRKMNSVKYPQAKIQYKFDIEAPSSSSTFNCTVLSSSKVCCVLPNLEHKITLQHLSSQNALSSDVTLIMDGLETQIAEVTYHQKPTIISTKALQTDDKTALVTLKGVGFEILDAQQLKIWYAKMRCYVQSITKTYIECEARSRDKSTESSAQVTLLYGYWSVDLGTAELTSIQTQTLPVVMEDTQFISKRDLILAVSGALTVGILIALAVYCMMRRNKKKLQHVESGRVSFIRQHHNRSVRIELSENEAYQGVSELAPVESAPMLGLSALRDTLASSGVLIELSSLHLGREIGSGCFGKVFRGVLDEFTEEGEVRRTSVAIKTLKGGEICEEQIRTFIDEALLMRTFRHEHVLSMLGISFDIYGQPLVILPYLGNGDLLSFLRTKSKPLSLDAMLRFSADIAMGMNYLQDVLCVHRDLAARNCMLDDDLRVKVADFGLSRDLYNFTNIYQSTARGAKLPVKWMSPESVETRHYSSKSDVWSFGVTMWEIFSGGAHPYPSVDNMDILKYVKSGRRLDRPRRCPQELYEWMLSCWQINPEDRPDFSEIVAELQLLISLREAYTGSDVTVSDGDFLSLRTRSSDSGNHSDDIDSIGGVVFVEDYLPPMPSTMV